MREAPPGGASLRSIDAPGGRDGSGVYVEARGREDADFALRPVLVPVLEVCRAVGGPTLPGGRRERECGASGRRGEHGVPPLQNKAAALVALHVDERSGDGGRSLEEGHLRAGDRSGRGGSAVRGEADPRGGRRLTASGRRERGGCRYEKQNGDDRPLACDGAKHLTISLRCGSEDREHEQASTCPLSSLSRRGPIPREGAPKRERRPHGRLSLLELERRLRADAEAHRGQIGDRAALRVR